MIAFLLLLVALCRALIWIGVRSWSRPERLDASWRWTRPAPTRSAWPIGPARPVDVDPGMRYLVNAHGEGFWHADGATEAWSPLGEMAAAEASREVLDDLDEWWAERLRAYDHALSRIDIDAGREFDAELARFQAGSMALGAYRSMILESTGSYGPREHMALEALLAA